jgi:hypothetical protein
VVRSGIRAWETGGRDDFDKGIVRPPRGVSFFSFFRASKFHTLNYYS